MLQVHVIINLIIFFINGSVSKIIFDVILLINYTTAANIINNILSLILSIGILNRIFQIQNNIITISIISIIIINLILMI